MFPLKKSMKILIFKPDNIGDLVLFSGSLKHIRRVYRRAHITLGVKKYILNMFEHCPYVDECVSLEMLSWCKRLRTLGFRGLRFYEWPIKWLNKFTNTITRPFDLIIYPVRSPDQEQLNILYDIGVKSIIGITGCSINMPKHGFNKTAHPDVLFKHKFDMSNMDPRQHELITNLEYLRFLGCEIDDVRSIWPEFWVVDSDKNYLEDNNDDNRITIGLFPNASNINRCWNADNYKELANLIPIPVRYVIFGGVDAVDFSSSVESSINESDSDTPVLNLTGKTSLRELYKCISSCDIFFGMDSCGLHMAIAAGIPSIGISGGMYLGRFLPWGDSTKHITITNEIDCFGCNGQCNKDEVECIQGVSAKKVAIEIENTIDRSTCRLKVKQQR